MPPSELNHRALLRFLTAVGGSLSGFCNACDIAGNLAGSFGGVSYIAGHFGLMFLYESSFDRLLEQAVNVQACTVILNLDLDSSTLMESA